MQSNLAHKVETESQIKKPMLKAVNLESTKNIDPLDEVTLKKTKRQHIKDFGFVFCCFFVLLAAIKLYTDRSATIPALSFSGIAATFYLLCIYTPRLMLPVFAAWMFLARYLEIVMTFVALGLMWSITFIPIGLCLKLFGKTTMILGFDAKKHSYWEDCEISRNDFALLKRQF